MKFIRIGLIAGLILAYSSANAATLSVILPPWIAAPAGGQVEFPVKINGASKITVGRFTLAIASPDQASLPAVFSVKGGQAVNDAGGCDLCPDWQASSSLDTNPALDQPAPAPVTAAFLLESGCANGVSLPCPAGSETGGVTGNFQEIARVKITLPSDAPANEDYDLTLSDLEFSDAASQLTDLSSVAGHIHVSAAKPGDANGDGNVNAGDAVVVLRYAVHLGSFNSDQLSRADVNGDGVVNAGDAVILLRRAVHLITQLPVE
jgi:hypothetical protein